MLRLGVVTAKLTLLPLTVYDPVYFNEQVAVSVNPVVPKLYTTALPLVPKATPAVPLSAALLYKPSQYPVTTTGVDGVLELFEQLKNNDPLMARIIAVINNFFIIVEMFVVKKQNY